MSLRRTASGWELVHPPCVTQRAEDLLKVREMIEVEETEVAVDELRWLLEDCRDFVEAHKLLGELALAEGDMQLARAHFGFAYQIVEAALPERGLDGPLPYSLPGNQAFFEASKGLAWCLQQLGQPEQGRAVAERLLVHDPGDPLGLNEMLASWPT